MKIIKTEFYDSENPRSDIDQHRLILKSVPQWNTWRDRNPDTEIWLQGLSFEKVDLTSINLQNAHLEGASFIDSNLIGANFDNAHLAHITFEKVSLMGAKLCKSDVSYSMIVDSHLEEIDASYANFYCAKVYDSYFNEAKLTNVNFSQASLIKTELKKTNVTDAVFHNSTISKCVFLSENTPQISMKNAYIEETDLSNVKFFAADLEKTNIIRCTLNNTCFLNSVLKGSNFEGSYVNSKTCILLCGIDKDTDFTLVALDYIQIEPPLLTALKTNIRRKEWEKYYKGCSYPKRQLLRFFWWLSDYGSSSSRILFAFLLSILTFAFIYSFIELAAPDILSNIKHLESPSALLNSLFIAIQSLCFALSTMVTLGFANININVNNLQPGWSILGLICVSLNLLTGYFLLAVLVTRLGILFQSLAPEQDTNHTEKKKK